MHSRVLAKPVKREFVYTQKGLALITSVPHFGAMRAPREQVWSGSYPHGRPETDSYRQIRIGPFCDDLPASNTWPPALWALHNSPLSASLSLALPRPLRPTSPWTLPPFFATTPAKTACPAMTRSSMRSSTWKEEYRPSRNTRKRHMTITMCEYLLMHFTCSGAG